MDIGRKIRGISKHYESAIQTKSRPGEVPAWQKVNMDFEHLYEVSPWCRSAAFLNQDMPDVPEPRIIKTHDEYELLKNIQKGKFIFVIRDFPDVIHSFHEHIKAYNNPSADLTELSDRKMKDWFEYNTKWVQNENNLEILYVHYEDLIADKRTAITTIAKFLEIEIDDDLITRVVDRTSFEFMKKHETKFGEQPEKWKVYDNFIRKGKVGDGESKFASEQLLRYKTLLNEYQSKNSLVQRYLK
jgi:sulfotransferase family protein